MGDGIVTGTGDPVQNPLPAGDDEAQFGRQAPRQPGSQAHARLQLCLRALPFPLHGQAAGRPQTPGAGFGQQLRGAAAGGRQRLFGQIDPVLAGIDADVLQEVDALQGAADGVRLPAVVGGVGAVELQHQPSDRIGRAAAVVLHIIGTGIARHAQILPECVDQVAKALPVQPVAGGRRHQPVHHGDAAGCAAAGLLHRGIERQQGGLARHHRGIALIGQIVGMPRKMIDGHYRTPQPGRHQP